MGTQLNETLGNDAIRQTPSNAPYPESDQNRIAKVGPFAQHSVAASQSGVALPVGLGTGALTFAVADRPGKIIGIDWGLSTAGTHTAGAVQATVGGTAAGDSAVFDGGATEAVVAQTTPVPFVKGDKLGMKITTDGSFTPTPDIAANLIVQYNP